MRMLASAILVLALAACSRTDVSDKAPKGNDESGAAKRVVQQQKAMNDLKQIGVYYHLYRAEHGLATTQGFLKYLDEQAKEAPALVQAVKDGQYVIRVPGNGTGLLAYEKASDYQKTRVAVMADGSVTKAMTDAELMAATRQPQ